MSITFLSPTTSKRRVVRAFLGARRGRIPLPFLTMAESVLETLAIASARDALAKGDASTAFEWLESMPSARRPPELVAECLDRRSMAAGDRSDWKLAERLATEAAATAATPWRQERLGLLRRRTPTMNDHQWGVIFAKVPPVTKLRPDFLQPEVAEVAACGAYFSRGAGSGGPWARYLRLSKQPPIEDQERRAVFGLAAGYFTRFIERHTSLLQRAELVVPVPANPDRYVTRLASLPDELARGVEARLALHMLPNALAWRPEMTEVEMKRLQWSERRRLAIEAFTTDDQAPKVWGRVVLLVDDITTSGSTLRACASVLLGAGASQVVACCLAHTEG